MWVHSVGFPSQLGFTVVGSHNHTIVVIHLVSVRPDTGQRMKRTTNELTQTEGQAKRPKLEEDGESCGKIVPNTYSLPAETWSQFINETATKSFGTIHVCILRLVNIHCK